jgi:hypothetical protein
VCFFVSVISTISDFPQRPEHQVKTSKDGNYTKNSIPKLMYDKPELLSSYQIQPVSRNWGYDAVRLFFQQLARSSVQWSNLSQWGQAA